MLTLNERSPILKVDQRFVVVIIKYKLLIVKPKGGDTLANLDVRGAAAGAGVRLWRVAAVLGISDSSLSRKLREELPAAEKEKILGIISDLAQGGGDA